MAIKPTAHAAQTEPPPLEARSAPPRAVKVPLAPARDYREEFEVVWDGGALLPERPERMCPIWREEGMARGDRMLIQSRVKQHGVTYVRIRQRAKGHSKPAIWREVAVEIAPDAEEGG